MDKLIPTLVGFAMCAVGFCASPRLQEIGNSISIFPSDPPPHIEPTEWVGFSRRSTQIEYNEFGLPPNWGWRIDKRFPAGSLLTVTVEKEPTFKRKISSKQIITELAKLWLPELQAKREPLLKGTVNDNEGNKTQLVYTTGGGGPVSQFAVAIKQRGAEIGEARNAYGNNPPGLMKESAMEVLRFAEDKNYSEEQLLESLRNLSKRRASIITPETGSELERDPAEG